MVIFDYTHTFTLQQLDVILTQYLQLGPYYQCLKKVLIDYMLRFQSLPLTQRHNPEKQHPIRLPLNFYQYKSKQSGQIDKDTYKGQLQMVYPLTTLVQILNSNEFYQQLPKNIIINGLLTTTNINIIVQTLTIVSEGLSKLIKTTLSSIQQKQLTNYINTLVQDCLVGKDSVDGADGTQKKLSFKDLGFLGLLFQKGLNMVADQAKKQKFQSQSDIQAIKIDSVVQLTGIQTDQNLQSLSQLNQKLKFDFQRKPSKRSSIIASLLSASDLNKQDTKNVVRTLKNLINQENSFKPLRLINEQDEQQQQKNPFEKQFAKKPKLFIECQYCRNVRNYLMQSTGLSYFDLQQISRIPTDVYIILKRIKNVTTVFTLYLRQTNRTTIPADINTINKVLSNMNIVITQNLWEVQKLNPKITDKYPGNNKKSGANSSKLIKNNHTLFNQLQPYFKQIYNYQSHQTNQYTIDELLRICLKAPQLKEVKKMLVQKYMNQARIKKQGKDIQTFFITKQKLNNQIKNQNQSSLQTSKIMLTNNQPFINQIQLLRQYQKEQTIINRAFINSKPIYSQINQTYQQQVNLNTQIKRHKMQNNGKQIKHNQKAQIFNKDNKKNAQAHQNEKFKMIMYQHYMKNQGFNVTKNNMSAIINQNVLRATKSMNFIGKDIQNSMDFGAKDQIDGFSQFYPPNTGIYPSNNTMSTLHLKTQEQNDTSYDKKETQIYNKMLLNGQTIRNQIVNQVQYGEAVIYDSLDEFLKKLSQIAAENEQSVEQNPSNQDPNQNLFLTLCGVNMRKAMSNKKGTPNNQQSLRNSKNFDTQNITKTQSRVQKKYSLISLGNPKQLKLTKSASRQKKKLQQNSEIFKQSRYKKQIQFKKQTPCQFQSHNSFNQQWNDNFQFKKPAWLDQYVDKVSPKQQNKVPLTKNGKTLLQNQRFLAFQERNYLQQCLNSQKVNKAISPKVSKSNIFSSQVSSEAEVKMNKSSTTTSKRPLSGANVQSKKGLGTIKSLGRTLSGKKRSYLLGKQFVIENNSLLAKIYKQNMGQNVFGCAKHQAQQQKMLVQFNMNIQRSKFRTDKMMN